MTTEKKTILRYPWERLFYDPALFDAGAGDADSDTNAEHYINRVIELGCESVVDAGCGTGRIALPLAERGIRVHCVDCSDTMLNALLEKMNHMPEEVAARLFPCLKSIEHFSLQSSVDVVIAADDFLTHFLDQRELISALCAMRRLIGKQGKILTDLRSYSDARLELAGRSYPKPVQTTGLSNRVNTCPEFSATATFMWEDYDFSSRLLVSHQAFHYIDNDGVLLKVVYKTLRQRLHSLAEVEHAADAAGLSVCIKPRRIETSPSSNVNSGVWLEFVPKQN